MRTLIALPCIVLLTACGATNVNQGNYEKAKANSEWVKTHGDGHGEAHAEGEHKEGEHSEGEKKAKSEDAH
ncbi:MAG: hypothetical protein AB8H79_10470 [Myxococcota bacterium]